MQLSSLLRRSWDGKRRAKSQQIAQPGIDIRSEGVWVPSAAWLQQMRHTPQSVRRQLHQTELRARLAQRNELVGRADETRIPAGVLLRQSGQGFAHNRR